MCAGPRFFFWPLSLGFFSLRISGFRKRCVTLWWDFIRGVVHISRGGCVHPEIFFSAGEGIFLGRVLPREQIFRPERDAGF